MKEQKEELSNLYHETVLEVDQAIEKFNALGKKIDGLQIPDDPSDPPEEGYPDFPLVEDLRVNWIDDKLMKVEWNPKVLREPIDIEFYDPEVHEPWQLSVLKYHPGATILSDKGEHPIGLGGSDTDKHNWKIRVVADDKNKSFKSDPFTLDGKKSEDPGNPDPPEEPGGKLITVFDDQYARIRGVIDWKGGIRIYAHIADGSGDNAKGIHAFDSEDLENWEQSPKPEFPEQMNIFQDPDNGKIYGFTSDGDETFLWDDFNPDKGCQRKLNKMYEWRQDGTHPPQKLKNGFIQLGRVRGYGSENEGRWDHENLPTYPKIKNYPAAFEAWKEVNRLNTGERWLKDRRGLSLHQSKDGKDWDSRIILDPKELDLKGFRGWEDPDKNGIADFYSGDMIDERRAFIKVYWKEKDRFIDRCDYWDDCEGQDLRRRFRFTGETTFIPAVLEDGKMKIKSLESVIPKKFHERKISLDQVHWATNPGVPEVGQLTSYGDVIFRNGHAFIFYVYRDDIHYEGGWDKQNEGVFIYRMPQDEFDALFE